MRWIPMLSSLALVSCGGGDDGGGATSYCDTKSFTAPANSPYILPYLTGSSYLMSQGNCSPPPGGHHQTFAYDMNFSMGDPIYAARAGLVTWGYLERD